jgi:hypothetical protein
MPHPDGLRYSAVDWGDDMRTFHYEISRSAFAKHISTSNNNRLQAEPTVLFQDIQLYVPLSRQKVGLAGTPSICNPFD